MPNCIDMLKNLLQPRGRRSSGDEVAALAVVGTLVLQPLSVSLHTANLLAVIIGDRVRDRVGGGVDAEPADAIKELLLFLRSPKISTC